MFMGITLITLGEYSNIVWIEVKKEMFWERLDFLKWFLRELLDYYERFLD